MESDVILVIVVATALAFDFTNGFHDTANVVATSISTRAMAPRVAVGYAAILNFVGAFLSLEVAATVASGIVEADLVTPTVVFGGLVGAITWNLITWYYGLPSSSSHALIGGVVGAAFVAEGAEAVIGDGLLGKVAVPALVAPTLAFVTAAIAILFAYRIIGGQSPGTREPRLPGRPDRVRRDARARARHERRAEDDGRDHAGADRERRSQRRLRPAVLGDHLGGHGDRTRDVRGRLANHPHDGQPHHQDGHGAGVLCPGRRRGGDPRRRRTSASRSRPRTRSPAP